MLPSYGELLEQARKRDMLQVVVITPEGEYATAAYSNELFKDADAEKQGIFGKLFETKLRRRLAHIRGEL